MIKQENWLLKYRSKESLKDVLKQMESRYSVSFERTVNRSKELTLHWDLLSQDFKIFLKTCVFFAKATQRVAFIKNYRILEGLEPVL